MEHTGVTPPGAVVAPDLADVLAHPGPYVSVFLTTESEIENASYRSEQHWKDLRRDLGEAGAPEEALAAIDPLVPDAHLQGQTLGVIANATGLLHVEHGPDAPPQDQGEYGPLPLLLPFISWRQAFPTHVAVLADRTGADLYVFRHEREPVEMQAGGDEFPIRKVNAGGWSQLRYQHRAENTWEQNAEDVASELNQLVERFDARLVVAAGDVRALEMLRSELSQRAAENFVVVDGSRGEDGSGGLFLERVREEVAALVERDSEGLLAKFREELGQADRAADGPQDTLAALARAQVEVLLVRPDVNDPRTALYGPDPALLGLERDDLRSMGVDDPREGPLQEVAVRAALGTGAGVRLVPDGDVPTGRLGAILRWS
jgi:hypothetical protein